MSKDKERAEWDWLNDESEAEGENNN